MGRKSLAELGGVMRAPSAKTYQGPVHHLVGDAARSVPLWAMLISPITLTARNRRACRYTADTSRMFLSNSARSTPAAC